MIHPERAYVLVEVTYDAAQFGPGDARRSVEREMDELHVALDAKVTLLSEYDVERMAPRAKYIARRRALLDAKIEALKECARIYANETEFDGDGKPGPLLAGARLRIAAKEFSREERSG